jgi:hypothetical protein
MIRLILMFAIAFTFTRTLAVGGEWPPDNVSSVKAFTFSGSPSDLILEGNKLHSSVVNPEGIKLNQEQAKKAVASLSNGSNHFGFKYWCFEPRDALVFYDKDQKVLLAVSICFTCLDWRSQSGDYGLRPDFPAMADLFAELGLEGGYDFSGDKADKFKAFYRRKVEDWERRAEARSAKSAKVAEEEGLAEQAGTEQPATRAESDSEGGDKPQPEAEGRSR